MAVPLIGARREKASPHAMTLTEHLAELRRRLIICVLVFTAAAIIAFAAYEPLLRFLQHPYCQVRHGSCQLYITSPLDGLTLRIKLAAFGGLVLSAPVILLQLWRFIAPGLVAKEKRYAIPFVVAGMSLFLIGCGLAYYTLPHALGFLQSVGGPTLREIYNPNEYLSLVLWMMLLFGLTFEFPVILVALELLGIVTPRRLLRSWRWAIISITLVAAIFTPSADPFSMMVMAVPLAAFYFVAIGIGSLFSR